MHGVYLCHITDSFLLTTTKTFIVWCLTNFAIYIRLAFLVCYSKITMYGLFKIDTTYCICNTE